MSAPVRHIPVLPRRDNIYPARLIEGRTHHDVAHLANHVLGRGAQLAPMCYHPVNLTSSGLYEWSVAVAPRYQAVERHWTIYAKSGSGSAATTFDFKAPTNTRLRSFSAPGQASSTLPIGPGNTFQARQTLTNQTRGDLTLSFGVDNADGNLDFLGFSCVEVPRSTLVATGTADPALGDAGIDVTERARLEPIYMNATAGSSEHFHRDLTLLRTPTSQDIGRRVGHFAWAVPYSLNSTHINTFAKQITTGSYGGSGSSSDVFGLDIPLLGRALDWDDSTTAAETVSPLHFRVLYRVSSGATATFKLSATSGDNGEVTNCTATSFAWTNAAANLDVDSELHTSTDGRRATRWDDCTLEATVTSGTVFIAGVSIYERD